MTDHELTLMARTTTARPISEVTEDGHVRVGDSEEIVDVDETWLYCETCRHRLRSEDYEAHGIDDYWEEQ